MSDQHFGQDLFRFLEDLKANNNRRASTPITSW